MFAIIETGGKEYKVSPEQKIKIEKLGLAEGSNVIFDKVLLWTDGEKIEIGMPYLENRKVEGRILREAKGDKKIVFKYHSKARYRKKKGHRQYFSEVKIGKI